MWATWPVLAAAAAVLGAGGAAAYLRWPAFTATTPVAAPATTTQAAPLPPPSSPAQAEAKPVAPSFDVVRVTPEGSAVIAGRAQPGAEVVVRDGERELGHAQADRRGEFVLMPQTKLAPGGRELTLASREGGRSEVKGEDTVVVVVPSPPTPSRDATTGAAPAQVRDAPNPPAAVAMLVPPAGAAPRLLQAPPAADRSQKLSLNTVDYDEKGEIRFSGSAPPSTPLRVYVDNQPVGEAKTDAHGQWTLTPQQSVASGVHQFRVDQLAQTGRVTRRVELPFQRTAAPASEASQARVVVQPGQNLWRIARFTYGAGIRYTVIYLANREQIRDPRLIYPGQVFATPVP